MNTSGQPLVSEVQPQTAWEILSNDSRSLLIDVRTDPEWGLVGCPDLTELGHEIVKIEWATYPDMTLNPAFVRTLLDSFDRQEMPSCLLFLCRSGVRSLKAANAVAEALSAQGLSVPCINVAGGFEGDCDPQGRRGSLNGWKVCGLPWRQT